MSHSSFDSTANKKLIRQAWNAKLLRFFTETYGKKLIYFGLPAPNAEDIHEWIDYLDFIVAFQCRDYPKPSDPSQSDIAIRTLENKLNALQRKKKINDFSIYDGYIEEVIINGKDNSNQKFELNDFITIYNLDFCNEITFPQEIFNVLTQKKETVFKLQIIKKIIDLQKQNNSLPFKFAVFLTISSNLWQTEADNFVKKQSLDPKFKRYFDSISKCRGIEKKVRILKLYIYQTLTPFLCTNNYIPEFLPVIHYQSEGYSLTHFTIIGTFESTFGGASTPIQTIDDFLYQGLLTPNTEQLQLNASFLSGIEKCPVTDPVSGFITTNIYKNLWKENGN